MSTVLVTGKLFRSSERKTSKGGKPFTVAKLKEGQGDDTTWWTVLAFGDAAEELAEIGDGDALSVSGSLKVETYERDGRTRVNLTVLADRLISARRSKKKSNAGEPQRHSNRAVSSTYDDALPF